MSIYDRWHKTHPKPGDQPCREHSRGKSRLYPSADHFKGDRWQVRWRDETGQQCKRNFPKKAGTDPETCAEAFDAQRKADTDRGEWIDPRLGRTPFRDYAPIWMKSRLHKPSTIETYEGHLHNHINPGFGGLGLAAIRPTLVQQWVRDLQVVTGLAPRTIGTIYGIFASIMRGALRDGYLRKSPCVDIRLPEVHPTVVRLLTPAQVLALAAAMPDRYGILALLGAGLGLRQGEAFGLALDRVDPGTEMVTVDQQVVVIDRKPVLASPKTPASLRDVPLPAFVLDGITRHVELLDLAPDAVLCRTPRGTLFRRDYFNKNIWKPAIGKAGLPDDTTFHDLRHTFASTALAEGVPISEVSRWLGHKSITITVDLYGHLVPEASGRARDALDEAFKAAVVP
ncbi:site-specific integrase [Actinomadura sp. KC06]|uniref:tyrosine-type recombinase/integrase n=1 Tax=Actinomadura sp. KC06 TaxID=2530369 RepID=UPI001045BAB6|nr:site-specific integrase [Actinomadura sp. KC06]TDD22084.1 site-specific integrase [Actinomadura sp. KC06]